MSAGEPTSIPEWARQEVSGVLISKAQLETRLHILAAEIRRDYAGLNPLVIGVLNGSLLFLADLARLLDIPLEIALTQASSYREATKPGELAVGALETKKISGRHVLLVDDILDTGRTLEVIQARIHQASPASLKTCVLLEKPSRRERPATAEYIGFTIADEFVVGYGLDFAGRYRQLPFIGTIHPLP